MKLRIGRALVKYVDPFLECDRGSAAISSTLTLNAKLKMTDLPLHSKNGSTYLARAPMVTAGQLLKHNLF